MLLVVLQVLHHVLLPLARIYGRGHVLDGIKVVFRCNGGCIYVKWRSYIRCNRDRISVKGRPHKGVAEVVFRFNRSRLKG